MRNTYYMRKNGGMLLAVVRGETTASLIAKLKAEFVEALENGSYALLAVDVASVHFMDSSGINFLIFMHKNAQSVGKRFVVLRPSEAVRKVLGLVQLLDFLDIQEAAEA